MQLFSSDEYQFMRKKDFKIINEPLHHFSNFHDHLLLQFALQIQNTPQENKGRLNRRHQQLVILASLYVVSHDFSG